METSKFSKQVFFIGAWKAQTVTDHLLRQIEVQSTLKKGFPTILHLTADGLDLYILNANGETTRTDKIPLQNIVDFINNKYSSTCILAIVRDRQNLYTVFVFLCQSERDAAELIQVYKDAKNLLSGEGYKVDLKHPQGRNWTLMTKTVPIVHRSENGHIRVMSRSPETSDVLNGDVSDEGERKHYISETHVQRTNEESYTPHTHATETDMKDELASLSNEVRDIKLMLQKSGGREHFEKHYGYKVIQGSTSPPTATTTANERIYDEVAQPQAYTRQAIYQKNTQYATQNTRPSYTVVREERAVDQTDRVAQTVHASNSASTGKSWYSKRVYDSGVEPVYGITGPQRRTVKRPIFMRAFKGSKRHQVPQVLLKKSRRGYYASNTVQKNIEHVYGYRSTRHRLPVPVPMLANMRTSQYVQSVGVAPTSTVHEGVINIQPPPPTTSDVRAVYQSTKETSRLEEEKIRGGATFVEVDSGRFADYENVQKVVHEDERNAGTTNNVIYVSYDNDSDNGPTTVDYRHTVVGGGLATENYRETGVGDRVTTVDYRETGIDDGVTTVDYRQTGDQRVVTTNYEVVDSNHGGARYKSVNFVHDGASYEGERDREIVIPASSTSSVHTTSSTNVHYETKDLGNNVYHVKAEITEGDGGIRTVVDEVGIFDAETGDDDTVHHYTPEPVFVKLETDYTKISDKWNKLPVIVPEKAAVYYDDDGNEVVREEHTGETRKIIRDSRVVHSYMDELRHSVHDEKGGEDRKDEGKHNNNEEHNDNTDGDRKRSYVLDEDALYNSRLNRIEL